MKGAKANVLEAIGNTPIVKLNKVTGDIKSEIYVKLEYMNPGGSIKERIGKYILENAVKSGELKPGGTIIEGTSGNTGVGLAMFAAVNGYKCIFVLADKQSLEKIQNLRAFGAKVIVCPTNVEPEDPRSYYSVSANLAKTIPNSYFVSQYDNKWNRETHYYTTGPEIFEQTQGDFDVFIAGVGTGGTVSGTGKYLKEKKPEIQVVGIDCEGSILAEYGKTGKVGKAAPYVLEGIGEDFLPDNVRFEDIDDWVTIGDKESFVMTRKLLSQEGIYTGGSGGGAVAGAIKYAKGLKTPKKILVILPDSGNRYASKIYNDDWMRENGYSDSTFNVQIKEVIETLNKSTSKIVSIQDNITVGETIKLFEEHGISQIPIYSGDILSGVVSENRLLRPVFEGKISTTDSISIAKQDNYTVIDINQMISEVASQLVEDKVVMVTENNKIISLLTNTDLLTFISKRGNY